MKMEIKTKKLIWVLIIVIILAVGYIVYGEIIKYGTRRYANGLQDGQIVLGADQRVGQYVFVYFNETSYDKLSFDELCQLYKCGG